MSALPRFTFDLDLARWSPGQAGNEDTPEPETPSEPAGIAEDVVAQLVEQARTEAYAEGLAAGQKNASAAAAQSMAKAAGALAGQTQTMSTALDEALARYRGEAVALATSVGRKLAGQLIAKEPCAELEALIAECLPSLVGVPHLVVRCHPELADAIRDLATEKIATSGYGGRLVVMGDPDIRLGDGRLEWVDGGLVRDTDAVDTEIDRQIAQYLAATGGTNKGKEDGE